MTWKENHEQSERLAAAAELAHLAGDFTQAESLYKEAAEAETRALDALDTSKGRTLGITAVSAVALFYKAREFRSAETLAYRVMGQGLLPEFAVYDLRVQLQSVWSEDVRMRTGLDFAPGEVVVSVSGGEVVEGGAPLDLILGKVQTVSSLFYRTVEWMRQAPHRVRGRPPAAIQKLVRPWLFQTAPGSYQFAVALEKPPQESLLETDFPTPTQIASEFLRIVRAAAESPREELPQLVPDEAYQSTILKLTQSLSPSGRSYSELAIRGRTGRGISLGPETRSLVGEVIRSRARKPSAVGQEQTIRGTLRALHLDNDWIEVAVGGQHIRVDRVGEVVDDVIGPMVNHEVVVRVLRDAASTNPHFVDIELEE